MIASKERGDMAKEKDEGTRSRVQVVVSLLQGAMRGIKKASLPDIARIDSETLEDYLPFLKQNGLMEKYLDADNVAIMYRTTPKGLKFLKTYNSFKKIAEPDSVSILHFLFREW